MKAIALNHLKPTYIASDSGILYAKIQEIRVQSVVDATAALVKSIDIVSGSPRH
jgi:competence protein ComFB